jgi:hypothetical protein
VDTFSWENIREWECDFQFDLNPAGGVPAYRLRQNLRQRKGGTPSPVFVNRPLSQI